MKINDRVEELLAVWEERRQRGAAVSAAELCQADPELLSELGTRIVELQATAWLFAPDSDTGPVAGAVRPLREVGEYEIIDCLGAGGMGTVYKARHRKLDKLVALKVLPEVRLWDRLAVARFEREMRAVGKLEHPQLVSALDAGEVDGTHYLAMQLIDGIDLDRLLKQCGPLNTANACEITRQAALGLHAAHEQGLVHRDVKPSNLMLSHNGVVKLLDLGLARLTNEANTVTEALTAERISTTGRVMGTLDYMAPEQCDDCHAADHRADIYGLGATLYKLLCGQAPLEGHLLGTTFQKVRALAAGNIPSLRTRRPDLPAKLIAYVDRMLSKDPADRPSSAAEVSIALAEFAGPSDLRALSRPVANNADGFPDIKSQPTHTLGVPENKAASVLRRARVARRVTFIGAVLAGLFVLSAIVLSRHTPHGELVVEVSDDVPVEVARQIKIDVRGNGDTLIADAGSRWTIRVAEGNYDIALRGGDDRVQVTDQQVTVTRGQRTIARVILKPVKPDPPVPSAIPLDAELASLVADPILRSLVGASDKWTWSPPEPLGRNVNTEGSEAQPHLSPDGLTLWFHSGRESGRHSLWMSRRESSTAEFQPRVRLPEPLNVSSDSAPRVTADGRDFFFVSMRGGGFGHMDVWTAKRDAVDQPFTAPVNLGSGVNTETMELSPAISGDGLVLVFSSVGRGSSGGTDLFESRRSSRDQPFGQSTSLGPEVNSQLSDSGAWLSADGQTLVFRSARDTGIGKDQLFLTTRSSLDKPFHKPLPLADPFKSAYWSGGFAASADWLTVVFATTRPGGPGGEDIWITHRISKSK